VAEGANVIRDQVRVNAARRGLNRTGLSVMPSGRTHNRRGRIPEAVYAYVKTPPRGGGGAVAVVGIKSYRGRYKQTFHWRWLEFGSIHNAPTPFFRPGFTQSRAKAKKAMERVYRTQLKNAGRFKKA
jgi:HK97 gp10 family phage protein